jgi:hypothetical protein
MNVWGWFNKILSRADYINLLSSIKQSYCPHLDMHPTESPSVGWCLSQRIPKAAAGKSHEQLISLERPTGIGVSWALASEAQRCGSHRGRDPGLYIRCSNTFQHMCCTLALMAFTMWRHALWCNRMIPWVKFPGQLFLMAVCRHSNVSLCHWALMDIPVSLNSSSSRGPWWSKKEVNTIFLAQAWALNFWSAGD